MKNKALIRVFRKLSVPGEYAGAVHLDEGWKNCVVKIPFGNRDFPSDVVSSDTKVYVDCDDAFLSTDNRSRLVLTVGGFEVSRNCDFE